MTEITQPQKFLFNQTFDDDDDGLNIAEREKAKPLFTQEQLENAQKDAFQEGFRAGQQAQSDVRQKQIEALCATIDLSLARLAEHSTEVWKEQMLQLQSLALVIARKILPTYVAQYGMDEIDTIVGKVIAEMGREPRLVIRVAEDIFDEASERINAIAAGRAYAGKLVILGDANLGISDCLVEWADGGIERDIGALWQEIERVVGEVQSAPAAEADSVPPSPNAAPESGENA